MLLLKSIQRSFYYLLLIIICVIASCSSYRLSKTEQQQITGKTYVITGASSGFGKGVALELGHYHANVVLAARRTALLEKIADTIRAAGGNAVVVTVDVSDSNDIKRLADIALQRFAHIDVWINDAGVGAIGNFWNIPLAEEARVIDVNLKGVIYGSYVAIHLFRAQGFGTLINVGSLDSEIPLESQATYAASKAGVRCLDEALY